MGLAKNILTYTARKALLENTALQKKFFTQGVYVVSFDPEMMYVECHQCGKPVIWAKGQTTALVEAAGIDLNTLDERCLVLSEGCPLCTPEAGGEYPVSIVRMAGLSPDEAVQMMHPGGNA